MKIPSNSVLLELHVPDFGKVKYFYRKLGFEIVWEREPGDMKGYLVMKMDDNILTFWAGNKNVYLHPYFKKFDIKTKRGYGVEIAIMVNDLENYYKKVKKFTKVVESLVTQSWGLKDFRIEDPNGFYLRFTEPHNVLDKKYAVK